MDMVLFTQICLIMNLAAGTGLVLLLPFLKLPDIFQGAFRLGLWLGGVGLLVQAERNYAFISGKTLMSFDFPIWVLKDVGYWVLLVGLVLYAASNFQRIKA